MNSPEIKKLEPLAEEILDEYSNSYSIVDKESLAKKIYNATHTNVVHGKWIPLDDNGNGWWQNGQRVFPKTCSACHCTFTLADKYKFCPECGCKMVKD